MAKLSTYRIGTTIPMHVSLLDSGISLDWNDVEIQRVCMYSDAQKAYAGYCEHSISQDDGTILICEYPAEQQFYVGDYRLVIQVKSEDNIYTYDALAFTLVSLTSEVTGIVEPGTPVEVGISISTLPSSTVAEIIQACINATAAADAAAIHAVPYIGENGHWWVWDANSGEYVDTDIEATGPQGPQGEPGNYTKPSDGIPKTDLASGVQTSLGKADTALQPGNVKQTTGSSTTDVMSQKAITDALNTKANQSELANYALKNGDLNQHFAAKSLQVRGRGTDNGIKLYKENGTIPYARVITESDLQSQGIDYVLPTSGIPEGTSVKLATHEEVSQLGQKMYQDYFPASEKGHYIYYDGTGYRVVEYVTSKITELLKIPSVNCTFKGLINSGSYPGIVFIGENYEIIGIPSTTITSGTCSWVVNDITIPAGAKYIVLQCQSNDAEVISTEKLLTGIPFYAEKRLNDEVVKIPDILQDVFALQVNTDKLKSAEKAGYMTQYGTYDGASSYHSLSTNVIPCSPGDVFYYKGRGNYSGYSYIFYNGTTRVSSGQILSKTYFAKIVAPSGVTGVIFSSYESNGTDVILDVYKVSSLYGDVNGIKTKVEQIAGQYSIQSATGFMESDGAIHTYANYRCKYVDIYCQEGDVFSYTGEGFSSAYSWVFFNGDVKVGTAGQYKGTTQVTIPSGINVTRVRFSSFYYTQDVDDVNLQVYKTGTIDERVTVLEKQDGYNIHDSLYGKKLVACGDSYTHGDYPVDMPNAKFTDEPYKGEYRVYPFFIGRRNRMVVVNEAKSGSTMAYIDGTKNEFSTANGRYTQIPADADYILLYFGINDKNQNVPIGTISDNVNTTFYGAWNIVMTYLLTNHPSAKIGIIVTNGCFNAAGASGLEPYTAAERNIAKKYGVAFLDLAKSDDIPYFFAQWERTDVDDTIKEQRDTYFGDGATAYHPNDKAHEYESTIIEAFLRRI